MIIDFTGFEWDPGNVEKNLKKHGVTCASVEEVFQREFFVFEDVKHSTKTEKRFVLLGESGKGLCLFIAFTMRGSKVRVISARPMSYKERIWYEKEKKQGLQ